jgi:hypothetical protein
MKVPKASFSRRPNRERTLRHARPLAVPAPPSLYKNTRRNPTRFYCPARAHSPARPASITMQTTINQPFNKLTDYQNNQITIFNHARPQNFKFLVLFPRRSDSILATNPILLLNFARS